MNTYIPPTGTIQLLTDVYLNPKQEDTFYFASVGLRDSYFDLRVLRTYEAQTYSRPTRNSVKIQDTSDKLYKCNYMRFKNGEAFGGQWIYAFVLAIEYVNNNTCEVFYQIDDMITWFPQCRLLECFVEREIPETDNLFENLVPENLEIGDYTTVSTETYDLTDSYLIIQSSKEGYLTQTPSLEFKYPEYNSYEEGTINGVFCPLWYRKFDTKKADDMTAFYHILRDFVNAGHADDIVNISYVPKFCTRKMKIDEEPSDSTRYATDTKSIRMSMTMGGYNDAYIPKNKKLFSYPYSCIVVSNLQGQSKIYKWEDFGITHETVGNPTVDFKLWGTFFSNPAVVVTPQTYKAVYGSNFDYALTLTNFPPAPWICDTFKAYLAQNRASIATSILSDAVSALASGAIGFGGGQITNALGNAMQFKNPGSLMGQYYSMNGTKEMVGSVANAGISGVGGVLGTISKIADHSALPNRVANLTQNDAFNLITDETKIVFMETSIKGQMAKRIDDFFSMYGYAQHKVKKPNINSRPQWNYTKTQGCIVYGDAPASALANISNIFDRGIRFWKNPLNLGNYELNNSVT